METRNLIGSFTLGILLTAIPVLSAKASEAVPNLYQFRGKNISITYSTTSIDGKPRLTYKDQQQILNFEGDKQIRSVETEIGTLVTVTIRKTVDTDNTVFTLILPRINLGKSNSVPVETKGIRTTNLFSVIPKFNQGQRQTYTTIHLTGIAQAVAF
ncbi:MULTISPECIES: hypothetical protein [unclassified Nostoc]|uniref:hypothetical protein n=1 Tax=unclassified Nostoc TaxID=2593658 RepID=UPI002AD51DF1|nr:hypothetical protein [Nostoc sp. DedQUE03]MDZ7975319.1 hypothetical protein [Nostoc sp. DedQUE03]MDZ8048936.1 hypothetical protein [Nostoc sp. DedQUE02]